MKIPTPEEYDAKLRKMLAARDAWILAHPFADVQVVFRFSEHVEIISSWTEAIINGFVGCNSEGAELTNSILKACDGEATVLMMQAVLEFRGAHLS